MRKFSPVPSCELKYFVIYEEEKQRGRDRETDREQLRPFSRQWVRNAFPKTKLREPDGFRGDTRSKRQSPAPADLVVFRFEIE